MTKKEYSHHVATMLEKEGLSDSLQVQLLKTVTKLLDYYSVDFVQELLPTLLESK